MSHRYVIFESFAYINVSDVMSARLRGETAGLLTGSQACDWRSDVAK